MNILEEPFYQVPKSIFRLKIEGKLSNLGFSLYIVFLERYKISQFKDEEDKTYFIFTYNEIMKELNIGSRATISSIIKELLELKLIEKKGNTRQLNRFYISTLY
ncbi:replication initiator protein A [Streptobacillus moniliformis]|uniref:replication initiator protein A n=1 Tax=Streptobacillus moniliformis TaxID=34105 RepID=UPI0007E328B5|nr:replication initiator protein A [Streptobacillus moniliformis]